VIGQRVVDAAKLQLVRERLAGDAGGLMAHQVFAQQVQQARLFAFCLAAPLVESGAAVDAIGDDLVVEGEDQLVVDQHVGPARLVFERLDLEDQLLIVGKERPAPGELFADLAFYQRLADEDLARRRRIQRPEAYPPARIDDDPVQRDPLESDRLHRLLLSAATIHLPAFFCSAEAG